MTEQEQDELYSRFANAMQVATEEDKDEARDALEESRALVDNYLGSNAEQCPIVVHNRAVIECATELYQRRAARNGVMQIGSSDLQPYRVARDPMVAARPILRPFMVGFA